MNHVIHRFIYVGRWNSKNAIAGSLQPSGFSIIRFGLVTGSVHLDDKAL